MIKRIPALCGCRDKKGRIKPARFGGAFCSMRCAAERGLDEIETFSYCKQHSTWNDDTHCSQCIQEQVAKDGAEAFFQRERDAGRVA